MYKLARFDEIVAASGARYHSASTKCHEPISLAGLDVYDNADDFLLLDNVITGHSAGLIWKNYWLSADVHYMPSNWQDASWLPGQISETNQTITLGEKSTQIIQTVSQPAMFIDTFVGHRNFGHLIHDTLPYGLIFRRARSMFPNLTPVVAPFQYQKQKEIFSLVFDFNYDDCLILKGATRFENMVVARRQTVFNDTLDSSNKNWRTSFSGIRNARQILQDFACASKTDESNYLRKQFILYLHRISNNAELKKNGVLQGRNFSNEGELLNRMLKIGAIAVEPAYPRLSSVADMLSNARLLVGIHGAQLANMIFCRPQTKIFEIRSNGGNWRSLEALATVLGLNFKAIVQPKPVDPESPELDLENILARIQEP